MCVSGRLQSVQIEFSSVVEELESSGIWLVRGYTHYLAGVAQGIVNMYFGVRVRY